MEMINGELNKFREEFLVWLYGEDSSLTPAEADEKFQEFLKRLRAAHLIRQSVQSDYGF